MNEYIILEHKLRIEANNRQREQDLDNDKNVDNQILDDMEQHGSESHFPLRDWNTPVNRENRLRLDSIDRHREEEEANRKFYAVCGDDYMRNKCVTDDFEFAQSMLAYYQRGDLPASHIKIFDTE